jgi:hypothetical protein
MQNHCVYGQAMKNFIMAEAFRASRFVFKDVAFTQLLRVYNILILATIYTTRFKYKFIHFINVS